jgi:ABC-2 type transport system permease protein
MSADAFSKDRTALATTLRTTPVSAVGATITHAWRAMLKIKHVPFQLFDVTITPIMFTLLFTYMFGGALGGSPSSYIQFLLPGILVQTIIFITVYTGVGLNTDIQKGLFERFRSLPMWQASPIIGALAGDLFRYSVAAMLIIVLGVILGFRPQGGVIGVLLAFALVLVFAVSITWIWIIFALKVKTPESVMTTSFLFTMPMTFMSTIFVGIETLPSWLQAIVKYNPVTRLTDASRGLMHGRDVGGDVLWVLVASALIVLVSAPIALTMYRAER